MAARFRPTVPLRTKRTTPTQIVKTTMHRTKSACPLKSKNALVPSHSALRFSPWVPPVMDTALKKMLSNRSAAASVMRANPRPRRRKESSASTTATAAANAAPMIPPTIMFKPRWMASWAAVNAPTPAKVAWQSESWPAMPVIRVMESSTVDRASPRIEDPFPGRRNPREHGDAEARRGAPTSPIRMRRSICGVLDLAAVGGGGGSMVARGSLLRSSVRIPGRMRRAATRKKNGSAGITEEYKRLAVGR